MNAALRVTCAVLAMLTLTALPAAAASPPKPPKLNVAAATSALSGQQIYVAPGAVATFNRQLVSQALAPNMRLLVEPFTGQYGPDGNYAGDDAYVSQVYEPLENWAQDHKVELIDVAGLNVRSMDGDGFAPSDIPEIRRLVAYQDVTDLVLAMIHYKKTGHNDYTDLPGDPVVPPAPAQLAAVTSALRTNRVYNAPDRTDPISLPVDQVTKAFGLTFRVAAFPPLQPGQPLVDYALALASEFPGDEIFVSYGQWLDVAGANAQALESARDYAYGRYEDASLEQGTVMPDRIGSILQRTSDLITKHPFSRPQPTPFDLQHRITAIAPWLLLGGALLLSGGTLLAWRRRRAETEHRAAVALRRESALATAAIATLSADLLRARSSADTAAAAERRATATTLFDQARTAAGMREVLRIADEGQEALTR